MPDRNVQFHFFATEEEAAAIRQKEADAGIKNESAYLRKMAIDGYMIRMDLKDVKEVVRLLRIDSNNLNQYAKKANETGSIYLDDIKDLQKHQEELWQSLREILKRLADIR